MQLKTMAPTHTTPFRFVRSLYDTHNMSDVMETSKIHRVAKKLAIQVPRRKIIDI